MRASASRWPTEDRGEVAVSEVVGFLLIFAILSVVLVLAMFAFNVIHSRAESSVVALQAESVAQRVAASAVDAALFAERNDVTTSSYTHPLELPDDLEGYSYTVHVEAADATGTSDGCDPCPSGADCIRPEQVRVCVAALDLSTTAPLFSAAAASTFNVCPSSVDGSDVQVRFGPSPCAVGEYAIYVEVQP